MAFHRAGVALVRTPDRGRAVFAMADFEPGDVVEASPVIPFPAGQGEAFELTVLHHHPYRWVDGPAPSTEPAGNHWSLAGREAGAIVLGLGTFINHSFSPTCEYRRDFAGDRLDFVALRSIAAGEEITVNYNGAPDDPEPMWFPVADDAGRIDPDAIGQRFVRVRIGESSGRGRGMFAAGAIRVGDVIERAPVIVLPKPDYYLLDEQTVLADHHFPWERNDDSGALVLGFGSVYNHSPSPNADYARDLDNEELVFFAVRDIAEGEEICWNYRNASSSGGPLWFEPVP